MQNPHFIIILGLLQLNTCAIGQDTNKTSGNYYKHVITKTATYPITRDTLNAFPDSLTIEGKLVDYTLGISCGIFCGCGSLKIKLSNKNDNYKHEFIYVALPCFHILPKAFKEAANWKLYKLTLTDHRCFWTEVPINKFDTKGLPFYILTDFKKYD